MDDNSTNKNLNEVVMNNLIGKKVRRHSILLRNEKAKNFYLLLGIIDAVEDDMQDYPHDGEKTICERATTIAMVPEESRSKIISKVRLGGLTMQ